MGLLLMEKKDWLSQHDQLKAIADTAEFTSKREKAAHASDLAEAKKREDALKKALGIEKECVANVNCYFNDSMSFSFSSHYVCI